MKFTEACLRGRSRSKQLHRLQAMALITWRQLLWPVKGVLCAVLTLVLVALTLTAFAHLLLSEASSQRSAVERCSASPKRQAGLVSAAHAVSRELRRLGVEHALCYSTLWGALKYGALLSWEDSVHLCAMYKEVSHVPTSTLREALSPHGLGVSYSFLHGQYTVTKLSDDVFPDYKLLIHVFYSTSSGEARHCGFQLWLNSFFSRRETTQPAHAFPERMLRGPLRTLAFHKEQLPVPNGDAEIIKYIYADGWWTDSLFAGPNCSKLRPS